MDSGHSNSQTPDKNKAVNIGNASNPSPDPAENERVNDDQLLPKEAEKYLREVASIEDYPDAGDQEEMEETIEKEKDKEE